MQTAVEPDEAERRKLEALREAKIEEAEQRSWNLFERFKELFGEDLEEALNGKEEDEDE